MNIIYHHPLGVTDNSDHTDESFMLISPHDKVYSKISLKDVVQKVGHERKCTRHIQNLFSLPIILTYKTRQ